MPELRTKEDIIKALHRLRDDGLNFWIDIAPEQFSAPLDEAWSPADNVRHLIKSTMPVTKALRFPRIILRVLFGAANEPSIAYDDLVGRYRDALARGGNAGRFAPRPLAAPDNAHARQQELVSRCRSTVAALANAAERWSERDLDRYRLPHPLLGKLTLREMLFFTLYHYSHHRENVIRRGGIASRTSS